MLERRPRVGERLRLERGEIVTVDHFGGPDDDMLWFRRDGRSVALKDDVFIWRFHDGLNRLVSHVEDGFMLRCYHCGHKPCDCED